MESFRIFASNQGLSSKQLGSFIADVREVGDFCETTCKFMDLLGKNKRFMEINQISKKYCRAYLLLTNEEKIQIISAVELNASEKSQVKSALEANPENAGKTFIIDYSVNESIIGGLQMYTSSSFMDLSLISRLDKIKDECNRMI
jgi:F-type H+-transporting ATPase subunit O